MANTNPVEQEIKDLEIQEQALQEKIKKNEELTATIDEKTKAKEALEQELGRVQTQINTKRDENRRIEVKDKSFEDKFKVEQLAKAKDKFFKEFGYSKVEDQEKFSKDFQTTSIDADHIYNDLVKRHVSENSDKYIQAEKELAKMRQGAKDYNTQGSGSGFNQNPEQGEGGTELDASDIQAAQWAHMPIERYRELKSQGKIE